MRTSIPAAALLSLACVISTSASASCRYEKQLDHVFPASAFDSVTINALAGRLDVTGTTDDEIVFRGTACSSEQEALDRIELDIQDASKDLEITVVIPYREFDFDPRYAHMDVEVSLPRDLAIALRDSSGDIQVRDAAVTSIDDSSGSIRVTNGRTSLNVEDSSGEIDIRDLSGDLEITDSSGGISVRDVKGNVMIPRDSSGDIEVERVSGTVTVERDGSGEIQIERVENSVTVGSDGSGDIDVSDVKGNVNIGRDGSGSVNVSRVTGDFEIEAKGSGDVRVRDVDGKVSTSR